MNTPRDLKAAVFAGAGVGSGIIAAFISRRTGDIFFLAGAPLGFVISTLLEATRRSLSLSRIFSLTVWSAVAFPIAFFSAFFGHFMTHSGQQAGHCNPFDFFLGGALGAFILGFVIFLIYFPQKAIEEITRSAGRLALSGGALGVLGSMLGYFESLPNNELLPVSLFPIWQGGIAFLIGRQLSRTDETGQKVALPFETSVDEMVLSIDGPQSGLKRTLSRESLVKILAILFSIWEILGFYRYFQSQVKTDSKNEQPRFPNGTPSNSRN